MGNNNHMETKTTIRCDCMKFTGVFFLFSSLSRPACLPAPSTHKSLTEDRLSFLLHLIEEELDCRAETDKVQFKHTSDLLQVHIPACALALCGWDSRYGGHNGAFPLLRGQERGFSRISDMEKVGGEGVK